MNKCYCSEVDFVDKLYLYLEDKCHHMLGKFVCMEVEKAAEVVAVVMAEEEVVNHHWNIDLNQQDMKWNFQNNIQQGHMKQ